MAETENKGNSEYKSDVFSPMLKALEYAPNVYNGMNKTDYTDPGSNCELPKRSSVLSGYMYFVNCVRDHLKNQGDPRDLKAAIEAPIRDCIENHIMEDFFRENAEKVVKVMVLDYTWERWEELIHKEEYEDDQQAGIEIGTKKEHLFWKKQSKHFVPGKPQSNLKKPDTIMQLLKKHNIS